MDLPHVDQKQSHGKRVLFVYLVRHAESSNNSRDLHDQRGAPSAASSTNGTTSSGGDALSSTKRRKTEADGVQVQHGDAPTKSSREPDPCLTSRGRKQAVAVARLLQRIREDPATDPRHRPQQLYTSGFCRALETSKPMVELLKLDPQLQSDLHEEGGVFEGPRRSSHVVDYPKRYGFSAAEMRKVLPSIIGTESVPEKGWWVGGQETEEESAKRARRCSEWLWKLVEKTDSSADTAEAGAVVCVTHGLFMDRLIKALSGLQPDLGSVLFMSFNCAYWLVQLRIDPQAPDQRKAVMACCNVVDHVPMSIRTGHSICGISHCQPSYDLGE
mmetsp:Transcript_32374/g.58828  ORF Transcript_32374/g.58828 Transcript_32374/m.58828 type:complete len:329 (+) Transcript_32374:96-1082(+)